MSFKRDGDDTALLQNLQRRRVGLLMFENIPDDEAKLLSNGRLTCLICSHRPVFDTFLMLASHRKGKKHISELGKYLKHKRELAYRELKKDHKKYLHTGSIRKAENKPTCLRDHPQQRLASMTVSNKSPCNSTSSPELISPAAEVRHYMKSLVKKPSLQKSVERSRETYTLPSTSNLMKDTLSEELQCSQKSLVVDKKSHNSEAIRQHIQLRMSGWVQNADGIWEKDPNAEFDSDDELPEGINNKQ